MTATAVVKAVVIVPMKPVRRGETGDAQADADEYESEADKNDRLHNSTCPVSLCDDVGLQSQLLESRTYTLPFGGREIYI